MMRRLAAGAAAAALGVSVLAMAGPAAADEYDGFDGGYTSLRFDAGPEPIWKGRTLSLGGRLSVQCEEDYISGFVSVHHADSCDDRERWHRLGGKRIVILFQADGQHDWDYVDSARTGRDGSFYTEARAYTSGTWRAVFEGARHLGGAEASDWVKVKH